MSEYPIPEELQEIFMDFLSAQACRDQAIKSVFRAKRAIYYAKEAIKARSKFWLGVYEIYPDLKGKELYYGLDSGLRLDEAKP